MIQYVTSAEPDEYEYDEYEDREAALHAAIVKAHAVRAAQQPGSAHAALFQGRIDDLTSRLLVLQQSVPELRKLDGQIEVTIQAIDRAEFNAAQVRFSRLALAALVALVGLAVLVMSVASWGPIATVVGLLMLLGGGAALVLMARSRRLATDDKDDALDGLRVLQRRKRKLVDKIDGKSETPAALTAGATENETGVFADAARAAARD